jgi:glycyl-tRNA synthetase beta subunit
MAIKVTKLEFKPGLEPPEIQELSELLERYEKLLKETSSRRNPGSIQIKKLPGHRDSPVRKAFNGLRLRLATFATSEEVESALASIRDLRETVLDMIKDLNRPIN